MNTRSLLELDERETLKTNNWPKLNSAVFKDKDNKRWRFMYTLQGNIWNYSSKRGYDTKSLAKKALLEDLGYDLIVYSNMRRIHEFRKELDEKKVMDLVKKKRALR